MEDSIRLKSSGAWKLSVDTEKEEERRKENKRRMRTEVKKDIGKERFNCHETRREK